MKTKIFTLLFAIVASIGILNAQCTACIEYKNVKYGDLYYDLVRADADHVYEATVIANNSYAGFTAVTIPNHFRYNGNDYYVVRIGGSAFENCTNLQSITFEAGIHVLEAKAFKGCTGLTSFPMPASVTEIQNEVFDGCVNLSSITNIGSVLTIGYYAFRNCTSLMNIEFPENHTFSGIGKGAFENVPNVVYPVSSQILDGSMGNYPWGAKSINGYVEGFLVYVTSEKTTLKACSSSASGNVTIPNSVERIQNKAFLGCNKITNITIPNSVTSIWKDAFYGCSGLTQINIPNSVTEIRSGAFGKCTGLTSISIPNSVTSIGDSAFIACENIVTAQIPGSVTVINNNTFKNCRKLGSFTIQDNVTSIGSYAFYGTNINAIVIPGNVTEIGDYAFANCRNLKNVTLGKKITQMNGNAFSNPSNNIDVYWDIPSFSSFDFSQTNVKSITFGNSVTRIPDGICSGQSNLSKLEFLSDEITEIGANAFNGCSSLSFIQHFPDSLQKIKANAFKNAPLISITIPVNVNEIGANAFSGCNPKIVYWNADGSSLDPSNMDFGNRLEELYLGDQVKIIHPYLFRDQTKIKEVYIPSGRIKTGAFMGCTRLQKLSFGIGVTKFDGTAFKNCTSMSGALVLPDALDTIPSGAFDNCTKISSVTIGKNVKKISGFSGCTGIKTVYNFSYMSLVAHSGGVDNPAYYADKVYNNMELQGEYLFSGTSLIGYMGHSAAITLPAGYKGSTYRIGEQTFAGAKQLSSVTIPEAVVEIGKSAFDGCTGLSSMTIPNSVTKVEEKAFNGCSNIATISFGANLTQLGANALAGCTSIQEINCSAVTPPSANANTFTNVPTSATLNIPAGSLNAYQSAQGWSQFTNIVETNLVNTTGVALSATTLNLKKGEEAVLYANVTPSNASYKTVTWSTSNSSVATVTKGIVYGKSAGTATITCTTTNGGYSATCEVTVSTNAIKATGMEFYKYAAKATEVYVPYSPMNEGDTLTFLELGTGFITVNILPYSVTNGNINFTVSDPSVVSAELTEHINFANSIKISPLRPGVAKVTISTTDGSNISKSVYVQITPDPNVKVIGVRCLPREITIGKGEKDTIDALVLPFDATNARVSWAKASGGNPLSINVKTIENKWCEITAKSAGTAYVYVETNDGKYKDTCTITIINKVPVTGLSLNQTSKTLNVGESVQLTPVFTPANATNQKVYWSMDTDTVATIENGLVTAIHEGTVVVTCISDDGDFTATCTITVQEGQQPVTGVSLNKKTLQISKGGNYTLAATVLPANATNKAVTWTSSNTSVATISNDGKIAAKTAGVSSISCETKDGHFKAECYIVVTDASQGCDYSFEPTAETTIQFEATDLSYSAFEGGTFVILEDASHVLYLMYYGSLANGALPVGNHPVSSIEQNGNIIYSIGGDDANDYGSFMATNFTANGYSAAYYIIAGNVSVEANNSITAKLISVNGSDIIATYRGTQDIEVVSIKDSATKILHNGQILILRGDKTYTLQGQEVK